jgi:hypothetical protein
MILVSLFFLYTFYYTFSWVQQYTNICIMLFSEPVSSESIKKKPNISILN